MKLKPHNSQLSSGKYQIIIGTTKVSEVLFYFIKYIPEAKAVCSSIKYSVSNEQMTLSSDFSHTQTLEKEK